ncbi:MAG: hypothetical protein ACT4OJ_00940 [Bacteroidota bacterium]
MSDKEFEEMKEWGRKKQKEINEALKKWAEEYKKMTKEQLHERLIMQKTDTLRWICSEIALPAEHYELCQMAKEILTERGESL